MVPSASACTSHSAASAPAQKLSSSRSEVSHTRRVKRTRLALAALLAALLATALLASSS